MITPIYSRYISHLTNIKKSLVQKIFSLWFDKTIGILWLIRFFMNRIICNWNLSELEYSRNRKSINSNIWRNQKYFKIFHGYLTEITKFKYDNNNNNKIANYLLGFNFKTTNCKYFTLVIFDRNSFFYFEAHLLNILEFEF